MNKKINKSKRYYILRITLLLLLILVPQLNHSTALGYTFNQNIENLQNIINELEKTDYQITINFDSNTGSGYMPPTSKFNSGKNTNKIDYTFPECTFSSPNIFLEFDCWFDGKDYFHSGDTIENVMDINYTTTSSTEVNGRMLNNINISLSAQWKINVLAIIISVICALIIIGLFWRLITYICRKGRDQSSYKENNMVETKAHKKENTNNYMYCRKCGKKIPSDSDFCQFCGKNIK